MESLSVYCECLQLKTTTTKPSHTQLTFPHSHTLPYSRIFPHIPTESHTIPHSHTVPNLHPPPPYSAASSSGGNAPDIMVPLRHSVRPVLRRALCHTFERTVQWANCRPNEHMILLFIEEKKNNYYGWTSYRIVLEHMRHWTVRC